jgi:hypothetical protein
VTLLKKYLFLGALALLALPAFQSMTRLFPRYDLYGYEAIHGPPDLRFFTWKRWFEGEFQREFTASVNDHTGFRNEMITALNQADFSLFRKSNAPGFIIGKEDVMYEEDYCFAYNGDYFIGKEVWNAKLHRLKEVSDSLATHGTTLLVVIEPGKASFFPEHIPSRYHPDQRRISNYDYLVHRSPEVGLPVLDLNRYFLLIKDTSSFPLFPRYGMHWSIYGAALAMDTLRNYLEFRTGRKLPELQWNGVRVAHAPEETDNDIEKMLNLIFRLPGSVYGYPDFTFDTALAERSESALVIADSYYVNLAETFGNQIFQKQDYWYYNTKVFPYHNETPPVYPDKSNLRSTYLSYDIILLMASEVNHHNGFWNFAEEAWLAFHPGESIGRAEVVGNEIRNDRNWFRFSVKKAARLQKPLPQIIREDALWVSQQNQ